MLSDNVMMLYNMKLLPDGIIVLKNGETALKDDNGACSGGSIVLKGRHTSKPRPFMTLPSYGPGEYIRGDFMWLNGQAPIYMEVYLKHLYLLSTVMNGSRFLSSSTGTVIMQQSGKAKAEWIHPLAVQGCTHSAF